MNIKKNLAIAAVTALLAVPAFSTINANASGFVPSTKVPTGRLTHAYNGYPAGTIIYDGHNGQQRPDLDNGSLGHASDNNHPLVNIPASDVGSFNSKVNHNNSNNNENNTNTNSTSKNSNKLVQTGANHVGTIAGVIGAAAAMVLAVVFAHISKLFKRN